MKKLSICSFLLLQFILCVASLACAQQTANIKPVANNAVLPTYRELPNQTMLNPAPIVRPQKVERKITIEDIWLESGGARVAFLSIRVPKQIYTAGYPWLDPASMPLLQPLLPYPPPKKKITWKRPKKITKVQIPLKPISQGQIKQGLSLTTPTKVAKVKPPHLTKKKEDTAEKFDNLYSVPSKK